MLQATASRIGNMGVQPVDHDWQLIERLAAGEERAMDELYARYSQPLFAYLVRLSDDPSIAEEILQETFVAAWHAAPSFQLRSTVKTWLFGIARRQAWNRLRRKRLELTDDSALSDVPSAEPEPESTVIANAESVELNQALRSLGTLHREVLTLTFIDGLSQSEVAEILSIPVGTVKSRLSNAKRQLRRALEQLNGHDENA